MRGAVGDAVGLAVISLEQPSRPGDLGADPDNLEDRYQIVEGRLLCHGRPGSRRRAQIGHRRTTRLDARSAGRTGGSIDWHDGALDLSDRRRPL